MAAKKGSSAVAGGILALLGSLVYLYVVFTWYTSGAAPSAWLAAAQFFAPFVIALAVVSVISLFFMSIGALTGGMDKSMMNVYWKFIIGAAVSVIILAGSGTVMFWEALVGFVLTYIGAAIVGM